MENGVLAPDSYLIFTTAHPEYAIKGYGDDHDRLERMYYKSAKSLEESVEIEETDDYEPDKWVEYNKACGRKLKAL